MTFDDAFAYVVGEEGVLSLDPDDKGNWTGGAVGAGVLKGSKYGVSAAAYPDLDIANLSLYEARAIAQTRYWDPIHGDEIPYGAALCIFDFGYNAGDEESIRVAQRALGLRDDGECGPLTLAALKACNVADFVPKFTAERLRVYSEMPEWSRDGAGWTARANLTAQRALT